MLTDPGGSCGRSFWFCGVCGEVVCNGTGYGKVRGTVLVRVFVYSTVKKSSPKKQKNINTKKTSPTRYPMTY